MVVIGLIINSGKKKNRDNNDPLTSQVLTTAALVDSVEIIMAESFPVQVSANVKGNLSDGCSDLGLPEVSLDQQTFNVQLPQVRPVDAICTEALRPFATTINLETEGLSKGIYNVNVNGVSSTFELPVDNVVDLTEDKG